VIHRFKSARHKAAAIAHEVGHAVLRHEASYYVEYSVHDACERAVARARPGNQGGVMRRLVLFGALAMVSLGVMGGGAAGQTSDRDFAVGGATMESAT
jgi:hypothetical protein